MLRNCRYFFTTGLLIATLACTNFTDIRGNDNDDLKSSDKINNTLSADSKLKNFEKQDNPTTPLVRDGSPIASKELPSNTGTKLDLGSGKLAKDFESELINGQQVKLSDYLGNVVVLNFWGTWCPPCRAEMPALQRTWDEYKDKGVVFLGVAIYDEPVEVAAFAERYGITYPLAVDTGAKLIVDYNVTTFPTTFLIDNAGNEKRRIVNPVNEGFLRIFLKGLLKTD